MRYVETDLDTALRTYPEMKELTISTDPYESVMLGVMTEGQLGGFRKHKYIKVKLVFDGETLVGHAWTFRYNRQHWGGDIRPPALAYMMYVDPDYRRRGIGTVFYDWATKISKNRHKSLHVFPWDESSKYFFSKVNAKNKFSYID